MARALFAELKPLYANSVWITKNNVKTNIRKLYMTLEANKEFMENLSLHETAPLPLCQGLDVPPLSAGPNPPLNCL